MRFSSAGTKRTQRISLVALLLAIGTSPVDAASITFDFQFPNGVGSSFGDAISLNTVGAVKDSAGNPIGFTHRTVGHLNGGGGLSAVALTAGGLAFNTTLPSVALGDLMLGLPFATNGSGTVSITSRYSGITVGEYGLSTNFELFGVAIGLIGSTDITNVAYTLILHNSGLTYQVAAAPNSTNFLSGSISGSTVLQSLSIGGPTTAGGTFTNNVNATPYSYSDNNTGGNNRLGRSDTYGYWLAQNVGGNGIFGTLTSITFSGPNFVPPVVAPEPSSLVLLIFAAVSLGMFRRSLSQ